MLPEKKSTWPKPSKSLKHRTTLPLILKQFPGSKGKIEHLSAGPLGAVVGSGAPGIRGMGFRILTETLPDTLIMCISSLQAAWLQKHIK